MVIHHQFMPPDVKHALLLSKPVKLLPALVGASSTEIIFTSGGTEADNIFLQGIAKSVPHVISSPIEHPAVLQTLKHLAKNKVVNITWLGLEENGQISLNNLEKALSANPGALVALMHGNNEVGNLLELDKVAMLCKEHDAPFLLMRYKQ